MARNRNSYGYSAPDVINERAEAASSRTYGGGGMVKNSTYVGTGKPMPDRLAGILGAPMATGTTTLTARASDNTDGTLTPKLNSANEAARRSGSVYMPGGDQ